MLSDLEESPRSVFSPSLRRPAPFSPLGLRCAPTTPLPLCTTAAPDPITFSADTRYSCCAVATTGGPSRRLRLRRRLCERPRCVQGFLRRIGLRLYLAHALLRLPAHPGGGVARHKREEAQRAACSET